jgi:UDP-N-acetylmuramoyl-L-alanyl-D-glutamate--2,6-diaminopimelate ligase
LSGTALDVWTVSLHGPARLQAQGQGYVDGGLAFDVLEDTQRVSVRSQLLGAFNASNLLVVLGGLRALGVPLADAAAVVARLSPVPGRVQRVTGPGADEQLAVVVDYAHTPDALEKVLQALRPLAAARGGRLWCVFGCGGNRDATKRPLMGAIAARDADRVVITSDNPRHENPDAILAHILAGITGHDEVDVIADRRQAIHGVVHEAAPGDVVLLAGKGHEDYQDVAGEKRPFSDVTEALAALRTRASRGPSGPSGANAQPAGAAA